MQLLINKIIYFPQWIDQTAVYFSNINLEFPKNYFKIFFAGNFGESQNLDKVFEVFKMIKNEKIKLYLVGSGRKKQDLIEMKERYELSNVHLIGEYAYDKMPEVLFHADAFLISLKKNEIFELTIPAKLQTYLSLGKPIISFATGITNSIVNESKSGISVDSDDLIGLKESIKIISNKGPKELFEMGKNAQSYAYLNFSKERLLNYFDKILTKEINDI